MNEKYQSSKLGLTGERAVLVASTGGHLAELFRLRQQIDIASDPLWITFDHPQSRSLLASEKVLFVPYVAPRDVLATYRARKIIQERLSAEKYDVMLSTGAAVAAAALPLAAAARKRSIYVESASRLTGPSVTGRILSMLRGIDLYTQVDAWAGGRWSFGGSVFDDFEAVQIASPPALRIFVMLGTIKPYRFDALVDALIRAAPASSEFQWQLGSTGRTDLPGESTDLMSDAEMKAALRWSNLVVSHAGVGSALMALEGGRFPILVPRRKIRAEHVDDHQTEIAQQLAGRGLALYAEVDDIVPSNLIKAASVSTQPATGAPRLGDTQ